MRAGTNDSPGLPQSWNASHNSWNASHNSWEGHPSMLVDSQALLAFTFASLDVSLLEVLLSTCTWSEVLWSE